MVADVIATYIYSLLADVIAMVVDVITTLGVYIVWQMLRPYLWLMELPQVSIYFKFSSEMLSRTSSHICGRWYLPMFLLRDGLLALMYRASFMVIMRTPFSSDLEEAMMESGESLSHSQNYCSVLEKLTRLHNLFKLTILMGNSVLNFHTQIIAQTLE